MIRARIDAFGMTVDLNLQDALDQALDLVAQAYEEAPDTIGRLLTDLAQANAAADRRDIPNWIADSAAEQTITIRQELADALPSQPLVADLNEGDALDLAGQLIAAARQTFTARARRSKAA